MRPNALFENERDFYFYCELVVAVSIPEAGVIQSVWSIFVNVVVG